MIPLQKNGVIYKPLKIIDFFKKINSKYFTSHLKLFEIYF
jgi:hypothetical protein